MAIHERKYRKFTHKQLELSLQKLQNILQLRDWEFVLDTSDAPPKEFKDTKEVASVHYEPEILRGIIWVSLKKCKEKNLSPKETLAHELFHVFYTVRDEEIIANVGASLICGRI